MFCWTTPHQPTPPAGASSASPSPLCARLSLLTQLDWNPEPCCTSPHRLIPTPDQEEDQPVVLMDAGFPHYNFSNIFTTPVRCAPLPTLW